MNTAVTNPHEEAGDPAERILAIIDDIRSELYPGVEHLPATLDSRLDKDIGLDSLAVAELLLRLERAFEISIDDAALLAESPRELLSIVLVRQCASVAGRRRRVGDDSPRAPINAAAASETLTDMLASQVLRHSDRVHVRLCMSDDDVLPITFGELLEGAQRIAAGLCDYGVEAGETVALMLPTSREYLESFFGVLWAGGIPVPIYPPARRSQIAEHLRRQRGILENAAARLLVAAPESKAIAHSLAVPAATPAQLGEAGRHRTLTTAVPRTSEEIAILQYTSGSTGDPKGVILSHANVLANIRAMGRRVQVAPTDSFVSWLPLYHDMGLIGAWLGSLYFGLPLILMSPLNILARPSRWLWAIHRHRATLTASPNFGYELCLNKVSDEEIEQLDLGTLRVMFNGAEPVSSKTVTGFAERFSAYGLRPEALTPVYGLAESCVGLSIPTPGRGARIDRVARHEFEYSGRAAPVGEDDTDALTWVACGSPIPGEQIRIVDEVQHEVAERQEGQIEFRGPSATSGYFKNPTATSRLFRNAPWLDTGDRGYMADGELFVTGRQKDLIIRAGRNIYPEQLEEAIGGITGIRKGCVAVFSSQPVPSRPERLVIVAETRETDPALRGDLRRRIARAGLEQLTVGVDDIVLAPPHTVLKTSSGKLRRSAIRQLYNRDALQTGRWQQYYSLMTTTISVHARRLAGTAGALIYSGWAWMVFYILAPLAAVILLVLPRPAWRWWLVQAAGRLLRRLTATGLLVEGLENLPDGPCVLTANHSSYLDSIVLATVMPRPFSYVVKRELHPMLRPNLRRLGVVFVERFDIEQSSKEIERLIDVARRGRSLAFFPEGTFDRNSGLLPFHMGAFVTAAASGLPVVPTAIRGARAKLRSGTWWIRPGPVTVIVSPAVEPPGTDWASAVKLRDAVREAILRHCGEPDLAAE
jgi:1-acyl-sn-glycerol-3-phosphate acyltransferase